MNKSELTKQEFKSKLSKLNLTQKQFAKNIGLAESTVKAWYSNTTMPLWAEIMLDNLIKINEQEKVLESLKQINKFLNTQKDQNV